MIRPILLSAALICAANSAMAQMSEEIRFAPGNFGTMVEGSITGDAYFDHVLGARAGQEMFLDLQVAETDGNGTIYFNLLPPGSDDVAIYIGSINGNTTTVDLPEDGDYTIRVYLMGNDRDAGATVDYRIDLSIQ